MESRVRRGSGRDKLSPPQRPEGRPSIMIILGVILILIGILAKIGILYTIGAILAVVGVIVLGIGIALLAVSVARRVEGRESVAP